MRSDRQLVATHGNGLACRGMDVAFSALETDGTFEFIRREGSGDR
jgi:hypothetical protein